MAFAGYAQDFVEATSKLVKGRTINIMDRRGCIVASTEKERIGTFHAEPTRCSRRGSRC